MARPIDYNRNHLHALFYYRADRRHVLAINQRMWSMEIGISPFHLNRIIQDFVATDRLKRLSTENHRLQTYQVSHPVEWNQSHHDKSGETQATAAMERLTGSQVSQKRPVAKKIDETTRDHVRNKKEVKDEYNEDRTGGERSLRGSGSRGAEAHVGEGPEDGDRIERDSVSGRFKPVSKTGPRTQLPKGVLP
jgi:hypothetical protein